jgi:alpha-mannosidase
VDAANVIIEAIKQAEDEQGIIVRLYEAAGASATVSLVCGFKISGAVATNLMEEGNAPLQVKGSTIVFDIRPFEIFTLKLIT